MRRFLLYLALAFAGSLVGLALYIPTLGPRLQKRVILALMQRFNADVQLDKLNFALLPAPSVDGEGLVISQRNRTPNDPPMIKIRHFHAQASFATILNLRETVSEVVLDGLEVHLPPRSERASNMAAGIKGSNRLKFTIGKITANEALLEIEPKPGKDPLIFPIHNLIMHSVGPDQAMAFTAQLQNAKPPGDINTTGSFGPWQRDDARDTPISGSYTFQHADLSVFKGISGILSSKGTYQGVLQRIKVDGTTDTPDFAIRKGGSPVHLIADFHSIVDGTNGDTTLEPVNAKFGNSEFLCSGAIVHHPDQPGKAIELQATAKHARMEDILTLVVGGKPIITGDVDFQSKILIPPGHQPVADKLGLDGTFQLKSAIFANQEASSRLRTLSNRATGISKKEEDNGQGLKGNVASNLSAIFKMQDGVISFRKLAFEVPGSQIQLTGSYNIVSSIVDMKGKFLMRATLSETQSGIKSLLLKPFDRHFEKDGAGFEVPISVTGSRQHPTIGVEAFHRTISIH